ncbi:hypothetical protein COLO4_33888 [Corchorus olitorius]|uniref:Uncharacterized protein n=1 Tax=Corchorus olitorius TaxID=93759 RepID=A0A1R3GQ45_9ROSI|nr:hypothetical protein COLO4_33888 [Corchorus olitorius]
MRISFGFVCLSQYEREVLEEKELGVGREREAGSPENFRFFGEGDKDQKVEVAGITLLSLHAILQGIPALSVSVIIFARTIDYDFGGPYC